MNPIDKLKIEIFDLQMDFERIKMKANNDLASIDESIKEKTMELNALATAEYQKDKENVN